MGRADAAEAHLIGSEEGHHEGLLVLRSAASHQSCQSGPPSVAYRGRQVVQNQLESLLTAEDYTLSLLNSHLFILILQPQS